MTKLQEVLEKIRKENPEEILKLCEEEIAVYKEIIKLIKSHE